MARRVFQVAGIYGLLALVPQYFMESRIGRDFPPAITHPEHFYGFLGVAIAWQFAFLVIARDPRRYRLLMLPAVVEKYTFGIAAIVLYMQGRLVGAVAAFGVVDLVLGTLFAVAFARTEAT
jgi:hypothetical protein